MSFKEVQELKFDHNSAHPSFTIRWNEFDFGTTSKHSYKICSRCFPLKVKHFNFFVGLIRESFAGDEGLKELLELYHAEYEIRNAKVDRQQMEKQMDKLINMIGYNPFDNKDYYEKMQALADRCGLEMKEIKL